MNWPAAENFLKLKRFIGNSPSIQLQPCRRPPPGLRWQTFIAQKSLTRRARFMNAWRKNTDQTPTWLKPSSNNLPACNNKSNLPADCLFAKMSQGQPHLAVYGEVPALSIRLEIPQATA